MAIYLISDGLLDKVLVSRDMVFDSADLSGAESNAEFEKYIAGLILADARTKTEMYQAFGIQAYTRYH